MTTDALARELKLAEEALALEASERVAFLARACGADASMLRRVADLVSRTEKGASEVIVDFLIEAVGDHERGELQPLEAYLPRFPGHEIAIARHYSELTRVMGSRARPPAGGDGVAELPLAAPRALGRYRIERELGRGGQGVVYLAVDEAVGRRVALKVLHPTSALESSTRQRFLREAGIASRLDHPGICIVYESGIADGADFIAMRYVEGTTLAKRIVDQPGADLCGLLPGDQADPMRAVAHLGEKLARSLHLAHEAGVIHRDVKSGNVMITPDGEPVILDFGLAREQSPGTTITLSAEILGTPAFMSPEQVSGTRGLDRRTDVWSLGVVLYQCLALKLPFDGVTVHEVMRRIRDEEPPLARRINKNVPRDLDVIVATALEKDVTRRYRTALDLAEDLRRFREHEPILARPAGVALRAVRWARRHPVRSVAASLGAAIVLLGVGTMLLSRSLDEKARELLGHSDVASAKELLEQEPSILWPVREAAVPLCEAWLGQLVELNGRRPRVQALLDEAVTRNDASSAGTETMLRRHLAALDDLTARAPSVRSRRDRGATLLSRTIEGPDREWAACIDAIAASPRYRGLRILPQAGLVPLGANPQGCFEFWHVESGARPGKDDGGAFALDGDSGMVLVLLPGGVTLVGNCAEHGFRYQRPRQESEALATISLDPFFIAKHEMTQGQWLRLWAENPSTWDPDRPPEGGIGIDLSHPVENVDWDLCTEAMRRLDLQLPTDAQWEHACRAGTDADWSSGDDPITAGIFANFLGEESNGKYGKAKSTGWSDPFIRHAPVGSFAANGFGIHDMHGNVWEWCRDRYLQRAETLEPDPGDGLRQPATNKAARCLRGGACDTDPWLGRSACRMQADRGDKGFAIGLRPARPISGPFRWQ